MENVLDRLVRFNEIQTGGAFGPIVGRLAGIGDSLMVDYGGNTSGPFLARSTVPISRDDLGREVLLVFEQNNPQLPIVIGLLHGQPVVVDPTPDPELAPEVILPKTERVKDITIDGERIIFDATKEIVLRCGEGSIIMRRDGKVIIKGVEVTTRAKGLNKIKGAAVRIN